MKLPEYPVEGRAVRAQWGREVVDALRALCPRSSASVHPNVLPTGTTYDVIAGRGGDDSLLPPDRHFQIVQTGPTSVKVLAGRAKRYAAGAEKIILAGVYPGWKAGAASIAGDTSGDLADYINLTGITATTHIIQTLSDSTAVSDALNPDRLTISSTGSATHPSGYNAYTSRVLGKITCAGSVITGIEQYADDDWDSPFLQPDGAGLEYYATSKKLQLRAFNSPDNITAAAADRILVWDDTDKLLHYTSPTSMVNDAVVILLDTGGAWTGTLQPWNTVASAPSHHSLKGLNDNTDDADHAWTMCNSCGAGYDSTYVRNYCYSIGDHNGVLVLDLDSRQLSVGALAADIRLNWTSCLLYDTSAAQSLNWTGRELTGDWSCSGTTDASSSTTGAFVIDGGLGVAKKAYIGDSTASTTNATGALQVTGGILAKAQSRIYGAGSLLAQFCGSHGTWGTCAAVFEDGVRSVALATDYGTNYAIAAVGDIGIGPQDVYRVNGLQVVGARLIAANLSKSAASGDSDTDLLIEALKNVITTHGLGAAA
jgi:hypothetical protein